MIKVKVNKILFWVVVLGLIFAAVQQEDGPDGPDGTEGGEAGGEGTDTGGGQAGGQGTDTAGGEAGGEGTDAGGEGTAPGQGENTNQENNNENQDNKDNEDNKDNQDNKDNEDNKDDNDKDNNDDDGPSSDPSDTDYEGNGQNSSTVAIVVGSIIGVIILSVFLIIFCRALCKSSKVTEKHKYAFEKHTDRFLTVDDGSISPEVLEENLQHFLEMLEQVKLEMKYFIFKLKGKTKKVVLTEISAEKINKISYALKISGSDSLGKWNGDGVFSMKDGFPFFWMKKIYVHKKRAGQTGEFKNLFYVSDTISRNKLMGQWYYEGFQSSDTHSGTWQIDAESAPSFKMDL